MTHWIELRTRIIHSALVFLPICMTLFWIDDVLYHGIAQPLLRVLPTGGAIIATDITTPFTVPLKLAFLTSVFIASPYFLYQFWSFIVPALYAHERQKIRTFLITSTLLFYMGICFAYFVICPMALRFFTHCAPPDVKIMTDISAYLDFMLAVLFAGGVAFQVPIVTLACIHSKVVSIAQFEHLRPYIIVAAFIAGMLLTPPDVVSQILLALPMWGLFEIGLIIAKLTQNKDNILQNKTSIDHSAQ